MRQDKRPSEVKAHLHRRAWARSIIDRGVALLCSGRRGPKSETRALSGPLPESAPVPDPGGFPRDLEIQAYAKAYDTI